MPDGFLVVKFYERRQVFIQGSPNGWTNQPNQAAIGNRQPVTLQGDDYQPAVQYVDIYPDLTTEISFARKIAEPEVS